MTSIYALRLNSPHIDEYFWQLRELTGNLECLNFRKKEDAFRSLFGNLLARYAITREKNIKFEEIVFERSPSGKPYAKGMDIYFNISHAGEWVVCATSGSEVGVDVEEMKPIDIEDIEIYFSEREREHLSAKTGETFQEAFYELWTLKESFIKHEGKGLSIPLDSFSMIFDPSGQPYITINDEEVQNLYFKQYSLSGSYKLAACSNDNNFKVVELVNWDQFLKSFGIK